MDRLLERLWQQDEVESCSTLTEEEQSVEEHFMRTHYRDSSGRFVVKIPFKDGFDDIGSSRAVALKRFMYLERKLERDSELRNGYVKMMKEIIQVGHIWLVMERSKTREKAYHMSHH